MLGKLFKHEFRNVGRVGGMLIAISGVVTLLGVIYLISPLFRTIVHSTDDTNWMLGLVSALMGLLGLVGYTGMLLGMGVGFMIYLAVRFYRSMYSDQGYLTQTLPVKASDLIIAKVVTAGTWMLIMTIAMTIFVSILAGIGFSVVMDVSIWDMLKTIKQSYQTINEYLNGLIGTALTRTGYTIIVNGIGGSFTTVAILFGAISLGQYSWKNKGMMGVIAYLAVRVLMSVVNGIFNAAVMVVNQSRILEDPSYAMTMTSTQNLVKFAVSVVFAIVLFFWSIHIVKNRLNME